MGDQEKKGQIQIFAKNIRGKANGQIQEDSKITRNTVDGRHIQNGGNGVNNDVNTERKPLKIGHYFESAVWTNHKDEPIKRAVYGQSVRLHITMNKEYVKVGEEVQFKLYTVDKITKKETHIGLVETRDNKITYDRVKIENIKGEYQAVIKFTLTPDILDKELPPYMKNYLERLYCRCSYQSEHKNWEHRQIPKKQADYLEMGVLVIDRYKMPGLKPNGSDIADDMTYGTGQPHRTPIYSADRRSKYTEEYTNFGFNVSKHALFADSEDYLLMEPEEIEEVIITNKKQEDYKQPVDNATIYRPQFPTPTEQRNALIKVRNKNVKAMYSKEKINELLIMRGAVSIDNEELLWSKFKDMVQDIFSSGKLETNILMMVDMMKQNKGGIYENSDLTNAIIENPATSSYCQKVEDYIAEQLKTKLNKLEEIEDREPYFAKKDGDKTIFFNSKFENRTTTGKEFGSPAYTWRENWNIFRGETIALNDIWSTEVILKEVKFNGDDYTAKYEITLWDHFGLDFPDVEIILSEGKIYAILAGFRAWFVLQHLWGYKPLLTKMNFTKEFSGNLAKGMSELKAERKAEEQRRKEDMKRIKEEIELRNPTMKW